MVNEGMNFISSGLLALLSMMPEIPEISVDSKMERSVLTPSDPNIPNILFTHLGNSEPKKNGKSHPSWLARFDR